MIGDGYRVLCAVFLPLLVSSLLLIPHWAESGYMTTSGCKEVIKGRKYTVNEN